MRPRQLLHLTEDGLTAYAWLRGELDCEGSFTATGAGLAAFAAYLGARRGGEFRLLADLRDEGHILDAIPPLGARDREALLARRRERLFGKSPLVRTVSLGRQDREPTERILFSALPDRAALQTWLSAIAAADAALAGIFSPSQLASPLLTEALQGTLPERCLLLSRLGDCLRESFIVDGETRFSRVVPIAGLDAPDMATLLVREEAKLRQYLIAESLIAYDAPLPAFALAHPRTADGWQHQGPKTGEPLLHLLDTHALARWTGLKTLPADDRSELLTLHLLATRPPRCQYAGPDLTHGWKQRRARRRLARAAGAILGLALPFTGLALFEAGELAEEAREFTARDNGPAAQDARTRFRSDIDDDSLRRISQRFAELQVLREGPEDAYRLVSSALEKSPAIDLDRIDWKQESTGGGATETIILEGHTEPELPARSTLAAFGTFTRALEPDSSVRVKVLRSPASGTAGTDGPATPRTFVVEMTRRQGR